MSLDRQTTGEIANHLKVHRSTVPLWIDHWNRHGQSKSLFPIRSASVRPKHLFDPYFDHD
jgi:transposase